MKTNSVKKIKVLQTLYSGLGGHGNVVFSLLESEFRAQFDQSLIFYGVEKTRPLYIEQCNELAIPYWELKKKPKKYLKSFKAFRKILNAQKPERIIIHSSELIIPAIKYAKSNNSRVYYVEHEPNHSKTKLEKFLTKYALKKAYKIVCLNEGYKNELIEKHGKTDKIVVIPNGIDTTKFCPSIVTPVPFKIGMAARITDTKDHKNLIIAFKEILKKYPKAELHIAGTGNLMKETQLQVNNLQMKDNVKFVGLLNEVEMIAFYQSLQLYVHATKSETLSTSILQAMACGIPVLSSDIKNNAFLIEHNKTGYLYNDQNHDDLALKIETSLNDTNQLAIISAAGRKHTLDHYTSDRMSKKYQTLVL